MPRIVRSLQAETDILETWDYIADDSEANADAWLDRLDGKLRLLATQPMMGRGRDELVPGLRSMPFGRYVIFYRVLDDGIFIARFLHSARDLEPLFDRLHDIPH